MARGSWTVLHRALAANKIGSWGSFFCNHAVLVSRAMANGVTAADVR